MHAELEKWLDEVWTARDRLLAASKDQGFRKGRGASAGMSKNEGAGLVYDMYNARDVSTIASSDESHLEAMRTELDKLERAINTPPEVQGRDFEKMNLGWMATVDVDELSDEFFHYRVSKANSVYRIYVNAVASARGLVFRSILADYGGWKVPNLQNAKVSSPDDGGRLDTIVLYLGSPAATKSMLECIAAYHSKAPSNFAGALPKLVEPASVGSNKLHGVGTTMEPPSFRLVSTGGKLYKRRVGQSFGAFRAELIFMALERTRLVVSGQSESDRKGAFKRRVEKYFRHVGIDPDRPALQNYEAGASLPSIETVADWANKTDKSFV